MILAYQVRIIQVISIISHIRSVAGVDSVGIGADFNGVDKVARGLEDVSKFPKLLVALIEDKVVDDGIYILKDNFIF